MLQNIRDRAHGWVFGVLIALMIIPFAFWGISSYITSSGKVVVAEVNGTEIERAQFQDSFRQYRQQLQMRMGGQLNINDLDQKRIKQESLDQLMDHILLEQTALKSGMRITDEQIAIEIGANESFKKDGQFANDLYAQILQINGMTAGQYEKTLASHAIDRTDPARTQR